MKQKFFIPGARCFLLIFSALQIVACGFQKKLEGSADESILETAAFRAAHVGISIYEPATGKYWFEHQGEKYFVPASNTKIPTCYAAMKYLGDSLVAFRYAAAGDQLHVYPSGDPSFLVPEFNRQPAYEFLKIYQNIKIDGSRFRDEHVGNGWAWNDYQESYMAQRSAMPVYGNIVRFSVKGPRDIMVSPDYFRDKLWQVADTRFEPGISVDRPWWDRNEFVPSVGSAKQVSVTFVPDNSTVESLLGDTLNHIVKFEDLHMPDATTVLFSQPTDSLLKPMMHRSDNFYAEQSLLMASNEFLGFMSDSRVIDTILKTDFKNLPQRPRWVDGSGLSRYNLFSPRDFIHILDKMRTEFGMERIREIFPTGNDGTLANYYKTDSGYIFAKTGTLSGVVALSGFLYTRQNKLLIFSVLVNNHQSSATTIRRGVEKFLQETRERN